MSNVMLDTTIKCKLKEQEDGINRAPLPTSQSVQAKMTFANNILVVGVVLTLAVRSSWELPQSGIMIFSITRCSTIPTKCR